MKVDYDVIVVGAGPAGSTAARYAAEKGASVLMLEKRQEIGSPVRCGEGIAKRWLDNIGMEPSSRWIANEVDGARVISPGGYVLEVDERHAGNEAGYVVHRDIFDQELAIMAARKGVHIMVKTSATGLIKDGGKVCGVVANNMGRIHNFKSHVVIGADGYESQVGRWAGIPVALAESDVDTCFQRTLVNIDIDYKFTHFYVGSFAPGGYMWIFPKGKDIANVGIGFQLSKVKEPGDPMRYTDAFIARNPGLAKGQSVRDIAGAVSICAPIERTVADGVMLVGDAARVIDPITGGGVINGCITGKFAGMVAAEGIQNGDLSAKFFQKYEKMWRAALEEKLFRNWMAKEKLATMTDALFDRAIKALSEANLTKVGTLELLAALRERDPELVREFEDLI